MSGISSKKFIGICNDSNFYNYTFAAEIGFSATAEDEKGILFDSGAIPVAVEAPSCL